MHTVEPRPPASELLAECFASHGVPSGDRCLSDRSLGFLKSVPPFVFNGDNDSNDNNVNNVNNNINNNVKKTKKTNTTNSNSNNNKKKQKKRARVRERQSGYTCFENSFQV